MEGEGELIVEGQPTRHVKAGNSCKSRPESSMTPKFPAISH